MSNFNAKEVMPRIEKRLVELGMSKDEFYERSGVSSASFSQWNTGKHSPTPKKLSAVAKTLQISTDYLLTGAQKEPPQPETEAAGLTSDQMEAINKIIKMSPENVRKFNQIAETLFGN